MKTEEQKILNTSKDREMEGEKWVTNMCEIIMEWKEFETQTHLKAGVSNDLSFSLN